MDPTKKKKVTLADLNKALPMENLQSQPLPLDPTKKKNSHTGGYQ